MIINGGIYESADVPMNGANGVRLDLEWQQVLGEGIEEISMKRTYDQEFWTEFMVPEKLPSGTGKLQRMFKGISASHVRLRMLVAAGAIVVARVNITPITE